ncbi:TonB-dependent receptor family protein [Hyphococcus sp.]|uniref:TonB-dependent receptor family protein n=1 Tax=Hyphococcus sp. TaxID=2038636 RepID=UPI0035C75C6B
MFLKKAFMLGAAGLSLSGVAIAAQSESLTPAPGLLRDRPLEELAQWDRPAPASRIEASDYVDNYANDAGDAFFFAPGVWVNALDLNEPRIVIRGFALGNSQHRSTVVVLRDGAPLTDVHGETNMVEVDLMSVAHVDVFRGGAGDLMFGGDNLGGVVDFVSPTGRTAPGRTLRLDGGSSIEASPGGQAHASVAAARGNLDYFMGVTGRYETGYRDHSQRLDGHFNANLGLELAQNLSTRFFFEALRSEVEFPGMLSPEAAADDPTQALDDVTLGPLFPGGPILNLADGAAEDEHGRTLLSTRVANATEFRLFGVDFDAGAHYVRRDIENAQIDYIGVIEDEGSEWGARLAAERAFGLFGVETMIRLGGNYATGSKSSNRFENLRGESGDLLFETDLKSKRMAGFVEATASPLRNLVISLGAKFTRTKRYLTADGGDDIDEQRTFTGVTAKGGVVYNLTRTLQVFASAFRSYEPPSMDELTSDDPEDFNGLEEQDAFSYEAGLRGRVNDWIGWDLTYFNTDIENEIINIEEPEENGFGGLFANVDETNHKGIEAGLDLNLFPQRFARSGHALTLRNVYNFNDFSFVDSGFLRVDGNQLAGMPTHVYRGELRYAAADRWFAAINVEMAAGDYFADHENEVSAPTYTLVGFSAGMRMSDHAELYLSGENLTDANFAAGLTPVLEQNVQDGRIFSPGAGPSVYAGLRYRF